MKSTPKDYSAIRIVAGPDGFVVFDANKKAIPGVFGVDIAVRPGKPPVMRINLICGNYDVVGKPVFAVADPATGQLRMVRRIVFMDGEEFVAPPLPAEYVPAPGERLTPEPATAGTATNGAAASHSPVDNGGNAD